MSVQKLLGEVKKHPENVTQAIVDLDAFLKSFKHNLSKLL
jgi:hypothetical protein